jgi:hypothetical protein
VVIKHEMEFFQVYCQDLFMRILEKFISYFLRFISFSMNFRNLIKFPEIYIEENRIQKRKIYEQFWADSGPASRHGPSPAAQSQPSWLMTSARRGRILARSPHPGRPRRRALRGQCAASSSLEAQAA